MTIRDLELTLINGTKTTFGQLGSGPVLVVNVASRCGLTPQYEALEALQKKYAAQGFTVVGLPTDQFKQELSSNEEVAEYCSTTDLSAALEAPYPGCFKSPLFSLKWE